MKNKAIKEFLINLLQTSRLRAWIGERPLESNKRRYCGNEQTILLKLIWNKLVLITPTAKLDLIRNSLQAIYDP